MLHDECTALTDTLRNGRREKSGGVDQRRTKFVIELGMCPGDLDFDVELHEHMHEMLES